MFFGYLLQTKDMDLTRPSGPQVHVVRIVQGLAKRGHRVRLVQMIEEGIRWTDDLEQWNTESFPRRWRLTLRAIERPIRLAQTMLPFLPYWNYFDSLRFADAARQVLEDVDILYERYSFMGYGGILLSQMLQTPLMLEVNGHPFDESAIYGHTFSWQQRRVSFRIARWTMAQASVVLPSGYGWERRYRATGLLSHDRVRVVWPGVDADLFAGRHTSEGFRERWRLPHARIVAFAGGFEPWQGLDTIVQAFAAVSRQCCDVILVLAGDGPLRHGIEAQTEDLGCRSRVFFLGRLPQQEVASLLGLADVGLLCMQNRAEFVGMKLFDYMASGLPSVVTAPERKHDLIVDGETGLVVEPGDAEGLAQALLRLLNDENLRTRLGAAAHTCALEKHSWAHRAAEIEVIALGLVDGR